MAAVLLGEAANQGQQGMIAVAEVIDTRCTQKHSMPYQVVTKRRAFACLDHTTPERLVRKWQGNAYYPWALQLAQLRSLPGIAHGATHFTRSNEKPSWALKNKPVAVIGRHAFYRLAQY